MTAINASRATIDLALIEKVIGVFEYIEDYQVIVAQVAPDEIVGLHEDHNGIGSTYPVGIEKFTADKQFEVYQGTLQKIVAEKGATCLIAVERHGVSRESTFPHRVVIRHVAGADPEVVALTLIKAMFDSNRADLGLVEAFDDLERAIKWVGARYSVQPTDRGDQAVVDGKTITVDDWPRLFFGVDRPLAALISHWGIERLLGHCLRG